MYLLTCIYFDYIIYFLIHRSSLLFSFLFSSSTFLHVHINYNLLKCLWRSFFSLKIHIDCFRLYYQPSKITIINIVWSYIELFKLFIEVHIMEVFSYLLLNLEVLYSCIHSFPYIFDVCNLIFNVLTVFASINTIIVRCILNS